MNAKDDLINELKKTSNTYHEWQNALVLRDRIYKEVGTGNKAAERVKVIIQHWHSLWLAECAEVDAKPSDATLSLLDAAESRMNASRPVPAIEEGVQ